MRVHLSIDADLSEGMEMTATAPAPDVDATSQDDVVAGQRREVRVVSQILKIITSYLDGDNLDRDGIDELAGQGVQFTARTLHTPMAGAAGITDAPIWYDRQQDGDLTALDLVDSHASPANGLVLVEVYTTQGHEACRATARLLGEEGVAFTEMSAESHQSLLHSRGITTTPAVVLRAPGSGRIITSWQGHRPDLITRYLTEDTQPTDDEGPLGGDAA